MEVALTQPVDDGRPPEVATEVPSPASEPEAQGTLDAGTLLWQVLLTLGGVAAAGLFVVWAFRPYLDATGLWFVERFGAWGVALAFGVPDATGLPFPPDTLVMVALSGGISWGACVLYGSLGSILGGSVGYGATRLARKIPWIADQMEHRAAQMESLVLRYGVWALAAGALTPLPYSLVAWACGLLGMPFRTFLMVSLLRFLRVGLYSLPLVWALS